MNIEIRNENTRQQRVSTKQHNDGKTAVRKTVEKVIKVHFGP